jgi:hypothetical protein
MDPRRRVASLAALGGAIGALAVDVLYVNLIISQRATMPGNRVPLIVVWIAASALFAVVGAFAGTPSRRAWLLGWSAAALLALSVPAVFSIGIPLLLCGIAIGLGSLRAAELLGIRRSVAFALPIGMLAVAGGALLLGFLLTAP